MAVDEIFRRLEKKTEKDLMRQASRAAYMQARVYSNAVDPAQLLNKRKIALEFVWFFAALAIGFLSGYLFYEVFSTWLPEAKKQLVDLLLQSEANFIYFLAAICFAGVYVTRLTIWALNLLK